MAKKIEIITLQGVKHEGKYQPVGVAIKVDKAEAERLIALGAADLPKPKIEEKEAPPKPPTSAELIEKIKAAQTMDELLSLGIGDDETRQTVREAFAARYAELNPAPAA